jgi:SAM-dependent methyltransferase
MTVTSPSPPTLRDPARIIAGPTGPIPSYVAVAETNLDQETVAAFGREWERFGDFSEDEVASGGREYFADLLPDQMLRGVRALDVGCGSGRWTRYLAARAGFVDAADPSDAVMVAARATAGLANVRVIHASVSSLPYPPGAFDLVASVGVLHHLPDTAAAIRTLAGLLRPGGVMYLYLYYQLEGRSAAYRAVFRMADLLRRFVSRLPSPIKLAAAETAAVTLYLPFIAAGRLVRRLAPESRRHERLPLHYYLDKPWKIVRNDALDRFGTPLERRFSRDEIARMLTAAGLTDIRFGETMPKWRVTARKLT